jgi:ATP-dependent protease ClpP protease subunit
MKLILIFLTALLFSIITYAQSLHINLNQTNTVTIRNEINDEVVTKAAKELSSLVSKRGNKTYKIYLVLDTPGGSIDSGLNFIEFAKTIPNVETLTVFAASMGSAIVEALPGKRNILSTGILMFHRARGGVQGQFENGELETRLDLHKRLVRNMEQINASRMSMSLDLYKIAVKDELWILGSEAIRSKAADSVVTVSCSQELISENKTETFIIGGLFAVRVDFSACPILRGGSVQDPNMLLKYKEFKSKWSINK